MGRPPPKLHVVPAGDSFHQRRAPFVLNSSFWPKGIWPSHHPMAAAAKTLTSSKDKPFFFLFLILAGLQIQQILHQWGDKNTL